MLLPEERLTPLLERLPAPELTVLAERETDVRLLPEEALLAERETEEREAEERLLPEPPAESTRPVRTERELVPA